MPALPSSLSSLLAMVPIMGQRRDARRNLNNSHRNRALTPISGLRFRKKAAGSSPAAPPSSPLPFNRTSRDAGMESLRPQSDESMRKDFNAESRSQL